MVNKRPPPPLVVAAIRYRELERSLNRSPRTERNERVHTPLGEIGGRKRQPHDTRWDSESVSQPMPLTTAPRAIHSAVPIDPRSHAYLSRDSFSCIFRSFIFFGKFDLEKVREEGLFLGYNLSVFLDIILKLIKINIFFLRERVCKSFGQVFIFFWNCDAFQRFFRTFAREI